MTIEPRAKRLLDMLALSAPVSTGRLSTAARRDGFAKLMQMGAKTIGIARHEDLTIDGPGGPLPLRLYDPAPDAGRPGPALVFFHGGGLVAGSIDTHDGICRVLANASGVIVIAVGYRLAPEAKFPAGLIDAAHAVDWIAAEAPRLGIDPSRIAVGGESAGALLSALVCNGHQPVGMRPRAQLLLCPVIDLTGASPSRHEFGRGYLIDSATVARDIEDCLAEGQGPADLPSPLRHGNPALSPPTVIVSAECDPFRDEAAHYAGLLIRNRVAVEHACQPGMVHSFYGLMAFLPQAEAALAVAGRQLAVLLDS